MNWYTVRGITIRRLGTFCYLFSALAHEIPIALARNGKNKKSEDAFLAKFYEELGIVPNLITKLAGTKDDKECRLPLISPQFRR